MRYLVICGLIIFNLSLPPFCRASDFPYREQYPEISIIELSELKSGRDKGEFIILDVRSEAEFNVLHINGAINIPYGQAKFTNGLKVIADQNPHKKIVVYDNGFDCIKCYKAAEDALYAMVPNVYAFDAGIVSWSQTFPEESQYFGSKLKSAASLIPEDEFLAKTMKFEVFKQKAVEGDAVVIDIRDPVQRTRTLPGLEKALQVPIDKLVNNILKKENMREKQLYIFDQVGRQSRWILYYLKKYAYANYYFLDGGATSVFHAQEYRNE